MGAFCISGSKWDVQEVSEAGYKALRADAIASEKVGDDLA